MGGAAYTGKNPNSGKFLDFRDPWIEIRVAQQAAHITKLVQLLGCVPVFWWFKGNRPIFEAVPVVMIALEALQRHRDRWDTELQRCVL